ncbi:hypothetical protein CgunFtcFv8_015194 [Champsocephalus gunnari]|uniref:Uncharacterized protein n=1 Tax=Champsocephalus gunnari TaxID=52237 RepID=A0AAN8H336_CHAGU|nr:hypothetical protein CgunFtcFv8_015194 [Champsocephalus gunnari]
MDLPLRKSSFKTQLPGFAHRSGRSREKTCTCSPWVHYREKLSLVRHTGVRSSSLLTQHFLRYTATSRFTGEDSSGAERCVRAEEDAQGLPNHGGLLTSALTESINESP